MKGNQELIVKQETSLLPFLLENLKNKSRNNIKSMLRRGQITIDGTMCVDYSRVLRPQQIVEVLALAPEAEYIMPFPVIYEDDEIIVIDKPSGMLSISTDKESENTAYHIVTDYVKNRDKTARIFIVHRIDRETSGVMLFAKTERIKRAMQDDWDKLVTCRGYVAVVEGNVIPAEDTITSWLKQTKTLFVYSSQYSGDGKKATTHYKTLQTSASYTLLDVSIDTGRKNQIRVHMKDINHPVAGDKKYGAKTNPLGRLALHANKLTITHPFTSEIMTFESKTPKTFAGALK